MAARIGKPHAVTATAPKPARIVSSMLTLGTASVDAGQDYYERPYRERGVPKRQRRAKALGHILVPETSHEAGTYE